MLRYKICSPIWPVLCDRTHSHILDLYCTLHFKQYCLFEYSSPGERTPRCLWIPLLQVDAFGRGLFSGLEARSRRRALEPAPRWAIIVAFLKVGRKGYMTWQFHQSFGTGTELGSISKGTFTALVNCNFAIRHHRAPLRVPQDGPGPPHRPRRPRRRPLRPLPLPPEGKSIKIDLPGNWFSVSLANPINICLLGRQENTSSGRHIIKFNPIKRRICLPEVARIHIHI